MKNKALVYAAHRLTLTVLVLTATACNNKLQSAQTEAASQQPAAADHNSLSSISDTNSPCRPFRLACQNAGFTLTSTVSGNKLILNCIENLVANKPATSPVTNQTAQVPTGNAGACQAQIHHANAMPKFGKATAERTGGLK